MTDDLITQLHGRGWTNKWIATYTGWSSAAVRRKLRERKLKSNTLEPPPIESLSVFHEVVALELRTMRVAAEITIPHMVNKLGMSTTNDLIELEHGHRDITLMEIIKYSLICDVPVKQTLTRIANQKVTQDDDRSLSDLLAVLETL